MSTAALSKGERKKALQACARWCGTKWALSLRGLSKDLASSPGTRNRLMAARRFRHPSEQAIRRGKAVQHEPQRHPGKPSRVPRKGDAVDLGQLYTEVLAERSHSIARERIRFANAIEALLLHRERRTGGVGAHECQSRVVEVGVDTEDRHSATRNRFPGARGVGSGHK